MQYRKNESLDTTTGRVRWRDEIEDVQMEESFGVTQQLPNLGRRWRGCMGAAISPPMN